jgi:hypothetical protein
MTQVQTLGLLFFFLLRTGIACGAITQSVWSYTLLEYLWKSTITVAQTGAGPEVIISGNARKNWLALRYNATTNDYDQMFVSRNYTDSIVDIDVVDIFGNGAKKIVVSTSQGFVRVFDLGTKAQQEEISTGISSITDAAIADVDGDGEKEIVFCTAATVYVFSLTGQSEWIYQGAGGDRFVIAQMDSDGALEIGTTDGHVLDGSSGTVQWTATSGFGQQLEAGDVDGDGMAELIESNSNYDIVRAYDVDQQLIKWTIDLEQNLGYYDLGTILVMDLDGDDHPEILVAPKQYGDIIAFDSQTLLPEWSVANNDWNVSAIAVGDTDDDGNEELLWGAERNIYIADWRNNQIKWQNVNYEGAIIGPEIGDIDGDGCSEMVFVSGGSDWYSAVGRIFIFDAIERKLRAISSPLMNGVNYNGIHDLKLRDVDGDGKPEILVAGDVRYSGLIEIYSFDTSNQFTRLWTSSAYSPSSYFRVLEAADIDDDQQVELVAASDRYIYVYSLLPDPSPLQWKSMDLMQSATEIGIEDIDGDGVKEIIAMTYNNNVYIFSGIGFSKDLEATISGQYKIMRVQKVGGIPSIILGNSSGELILYRYSSGEYVETHRKKLVDAAIEGITIDSKDRLWISTTENGIGTLREMLFDGTILSTYSDGLGSFGLRTAIMPSDRYFYTAGNDTIRTFPVFGSRACDSDIDGDGRSDQMVWRPSSGTWYGLSSTEPGAYISTRWGMAADTPLAGDFDGDKRFDFAVWRPETGIWFILPSGSPGTYNATQWGQELDVPVPGDYDGDGKVDIAVWRPDTGTWFVLPSNSPGTYTATQWGQVPDVPVPGDYDGDGKVDIAVWRPDIGIWFILPSSAPGTYIATQWGQELDVPVPGDYDGDEIADISVWRPSTGIWYILQSESPGTYQATQWGLSTDIPVSGDYDGDGKNDITIWRPDTGYWYILPTMAPGAYLSLQWGMNGDRPISAITDILNKMP